MSHYRLDSVCDIEVGIVILDRRILYYPTNTYSKWLLDDTGSSEGGWGPPNVGASTIGSSFSGPSKKGPFGF